MLVNKSITSSFNPILHLKVHGASFVVTPSGKKRYKVKQLGQITGGERLTNQDEIISK